MHLNRFYGVQDLMHMPNADMAFWASRAWVNPPNPAIGQPVTSATTFTPIAPITQLNGANTVTTIVPPFVGFVGKITVIANAALVFNTGGTAGSAIGAAVTAATGRAYDLVYDGTTWYVN